jgi:F0F1-type ATP synthase membrane subunit b/b'
MILSVSSLLSVSFIALVAFIYKTSAKRIISFLDDKILAVKHSLEDIEDIKKDSMLEVQQLNQSYEDLSKEIKYIINHSEQELDRILENLNINIALYEKELQQKAKFIIAQKKELILKKFNETAAKKVESLVTQYVSKQDSIVDINSLIATLSTTTSL